MGVKRPVLMRELAVNPRAVDVLIPDLSSVETSPIRILDACRSTMSVLSSVVLDALFIKARFVAEDHPAVLAACAESAFVIDQVFRSPDGYLRPVEYSSSVAQLIGQGEAFVMSIFDDEREAFTSGPWALLWKRLEKCVALQRTALADLHGPEVASLSVTNATDLLSRLCGEGFAQVGLWTAGLPGALAFWGHTNSPSELQAISRASVGMMTQLAMTNITKIRDFLFQFGIFEDLSNKIRTSPYPSSVFVPALNSLGYVDKLNWSDEASNIFREMGITGCPASFPLGRKSLRSLDRTTIECAVYIGTSIAPSTVWNPDCDT